ncbi:HAMP domain-containing histidine kinase [Plectonema cf. radiosum LEGE 06105]|uniref:histidine kinase n=1 Tax=Plectonema cf. radiosum LEGE 06105 TaxID=945769 RepID=A0A8J7F277_9CYAN|nr:HAMP domain-containing sensor histidine kinase [Plectonema radiosum]MBE9214806.1 HAMP domain-containing histidine kinase [Plectonema cf. radiosum LEGE 06105]
MNLNNWVYFGVGLALGIGICWLFLGSKTSNNSSFSLSKEENKQDISALSQRMREVEIAYHMAREMSQFKAGFLARTTHVLRSPLNGLIGLHQLILSDLCENPEEEREFISQAHERALKLLNLIDEILNIARAEHGDHKLEIQSCSLSQILQEVQELTYMLAENRNYPFEVLQPREDIYVLSDQRWLKQILTSLVDTAISQMEEGTINISAKADREKNLAYIWLDAPEDAIPSSEPINLIESAEDTKKVDEQQSKLLQAGMKLLLNQTLLEVMGGKIEPVFYPKTNNNENISRLQISIPLGILEADSHH